MPVNYIVDRQTKRKVLLFKLIYVTQDEVKRYVTYEKLIEKIFNNNQPGKEIEDIRHKLKSIILRSEKEKDIYNFLVDNQWVLRFAYENDIKHLLRHKRFPINKISISVPYTAYMGENNNNKLFYQKIVIPVWKKEKVQMQSDIITWLFLDNLATFEERLYSISLSTTDYIRDVIYQNPWILMYISNAKRSVLMERMDISFSEQNIVTGYQANKENPKKYDLKYDMVALPDVIKGPYVAFSNDLVKILTSNDKTLDERLIAYCRCEKNDYFLDRKYSFLRQNLWILDLINNKTKEQILRLLGLIDVTKQKKIITLTPKPYKKGLYSKQLNVSIEDYKDYRDLNKKLFTIFANGETEVSNDDILSFIKSDDRVLKIWPWLAKYINDADFGELKKKK